MPRILLIIGGAINVFFTLFHILLGYNIYRLPDLPEHYRSLMTMLNAGGATFILFMAIASLALTQEMLTTRLGKLVMLFTAFLYGSRALEEIIVSPHFSTFIFTACMIVAVIYIIPLLSMKKIIAQTE